MEPQPTGRITRTGPESYDLTFSRLFSEPPDAVWSSFTDSAQTASWFGRWQGTPARGSWLDLQMLYEDGLPWSRLQVSECTAPELLRLLVEDEYGSWDLEIRFQGRSGGTRLDFIHHLDDPLAAEGVGPGWEYYLDRLAAVRGGATVPEFGDYYPGQGPYFLAQARAAADADETGGIG
ncbi:MULTISPECIES: SRPBCC domain-containing protein [unclassified Arthrobacter]|uniref:SRPBCC domain-containing protein n=1 Tax=unclassified Arthrobacter TaxID=235627 RepID=UPI000CE553EA|nr:MULTISPECIES: SRPBCC domain-containing protein [unclassified Arthrobacter]